MARMSESELVRAIEAMEENSYGWGDGELSERREEAVKAFQGEQIIPAIEGRSSVNSTSFRDTCLWIMPQLLRTFVGGDQVVEFAPDGPDDEQVAKQESEVIQKIAERSNPFIQLNACFMDALQCANGYLKTWWEQNEDILEERYVGKTDDELAVLMHDPDVEVIEHTAYPDPGFIAPPPMLDPMGQPMPVPPTPMLHDVVVKRVRVDEYAKWEACPPDEMRISKRARSVSLQDCEFVQHRRKVTLSDLREMGYDVPDDIGDWYDDDEEFEAKNRWSDEWDDDDETDPASRRVTYRESYCLLDVNRDGRAERVKVCMVGKKVLHQENADMVPFASISPILLPHSHIGMSFFDLMEELESIRTTLLRSYFDGLYLSLNQRTAIDDSAVNVDDLLISRPGGIVRTRGTPADKIMPLPVMPTGDVALQGLQLLDAWKMDSTGVSPMTQGGPGLDAKNIHDAAGITVSQLVSQAQMRIEAIARSFSETGVKDLFLLLHHLTLKHAKKEITVQIRNNWITVDPRTWRKRNSVVCNVALGSGTREMRTAQLQSLLAAQMQLLATGVVTPPNIYSTMEKLVQEMGFKTPDQFVTNPAQNPPQPPPPDPLVQAQTIKSQADVQTEQMRLQAKAQDDSRKAQLEQQSAQLSVQQKQAELSMQAELEREKAARQAQTQIEVARINAEIKMQTELELERIRQQKAETDDTWRSETGGNVDRILAALEQMALHQHSLAAELAKSAAPKRIARGPRGEIVGAIGPDGEVTHAVERDARGKVVGVVRTSEPQVTVPDLQAMTAPPQKPERVAINQLGEQMAQMMSAIQNIAGTVQGIAQELHAPKEIVRDANGKVVGTMVNGRPHHQVVRDKSGKVAGMMRMQ